ncbi:MAG: hypothetical protein Kow00121_13060 [Elainellaceae cyanobacterium]
MFYVGEHNWLFRRFHHLLGAISIAFFSVLPLEQVWAQVIEDGTTRTRVESCGRNCIDVDGGTQGGGNLFHSFLQFSPGRDTVRFINNNPEVRNVINRVTGTSASRVDGLIQSSGTSPNFNLFLLNPYGIIFGANARLDIRGSFVTTTADAIRFGNLGDFSAANLDQDLSLLTIEPSAFLFNQLAPQPIVYQFNPANLANDPRTIPRIEVPNGESILFLGGDVRLNGGGAVDRYVGTLFAPNGQIELVAVAEQGIVELFTTNDRLRLRTPSNIALADISLTGAASVRTDNGGNIQLVGRRIRLADGARVSVSVFNANRGGALTVFASESVRMIGNAQNGNSSGLFAQAARPRSGRVGDLHVITQRLFIQDGAEISTTTLSSRRASQIIVEASESVYLSGVASTFNQFGRQQPSGLFSASRRASGNAGVIRVETEQLIVRNGARISASTDDGSTGRGGNVTVIAARSVQLEGADPELGPSGLLVGTTGDGNAGNLRLETEQLTIWEGAQISARSSGAGQSGRLVINAQSIEVAGTSENGELSQIATEASGTGDAGRLRLTTRQLTLEEGAELSTRTASGNGGNINLQVQDLLLLRRSGQISTTAGTAQGSGNGGNITIDAGNGAIIAVPGENSDITANAFEGSGGDINIRAGNVLGLTVRNEVTALNDITASSELGTAGEIQLNTPNLDPTQGLTELPVELATPTIEQRCYAQTISANSEFINSGRGGLPPDPSNSSNSGLVWDDLRSPSSNSTDRPLSTTTLPPLSASPEPIVEAQGWVVGEDGQVMLVAHSPFNTADPSYRSWQISPPCPAS